MPIDRLILIGALAVAATACSDSTTPRIRETAATSLVAGDVSTCALTSAGAAYCWGGDQLGQLGIGQRPGPSQSTPVPVSGGHTFAELLGAGAMFCGVNSTSHIWCWGGQAGGQSTEFFHDSLPTSAGGSMSFVKIASGPIHTCGLTSGGDAYCWGQNSFGQLGTGDTLRTATPVRVQGGLKWSAISVGFLHTCALTTTGTPYCWGYPGLGALGNPTVDTNFAQTTPLAVNGGLTLTSISAGTLYSCGVTAAGSAYCWGDNVSGQLGDGTDTIRVTPVPVAMPAGITFTTIAVSRANDGAGTSCGLTATGVAYCWGMGGQGQLGSASTSSFVPIPVSGGLTFSALAVGDVHVCGVTTAGAVDCWGGNAFGQLGDGDTTATSVPTPVAGNFHAP